MKWGRLLEAAFDAFWISCLVIAAGLVSGIAYGWLVGTGVAAGIAGVFYMVNRAVESAVRKSRETKIPQRSFPEKRSNPTREP